MAILEELKAAGANITDWNATVLFIGRLPLPRDRREGYLRLAAAAKDRQPSILEIEQVRQAPSP